MKLNYVQLCHNNLLPLTTLLNLLHLGHQQVDNFGISKLHRKRKRIKNSLVILGFCLGGGHDPKCLTSVVNSKNFDALHVF